MLSCLQILEAFLWFVLFFFQAEDGIRDADVTEVQTCALPISFTLIFRKMAKSIEDLIRNARSSAVEDFKKRFKQKWFNDVPCFHWKELEISDELKPIVLTNHPSVWLFSLDDSKQFDDIQDRKSVV